MIFKMQKTSTHLKYRKIEVNFRMHLLCDYNQIQENEEFMNSQIEAEMFRH